MAYLPGGDLTPARLAWSLPGSHAQLARQRAEARLRAMWRENKPSTKVRGGGRPMSRGGELILMDKPQNLDTRSVWRVAAIATCLATNQQAQADVRASPRDASPLLSLQQTRLQCELLGLGAVDSVPFNFPGATPQEIEAGRPLNPGIVESCLPPGGNPDAPIVWGGDLGQPFEHGDGKLYFNFGDAWFDGVVRTSPVPSEAGQPALPGAPLNDDVLASVGVAQIEQGPACMALDIPRAGDVGSVIPITWDGPANEGGQPLGSGAVPGPGFSTGPYMFMLVTRDSPTCGDTDGDCAAANGLASDACLIATDGVPRCFFGECLLDDPGSACGLRLNPSQLLVRGAGSDFVEAEVGVHIASARVLDAYRGHFSTVAFASQVDFETGDGEVWVVGRDTFWGAPGLHMSPYLMVHPVHRGQLGEPSFFAGWRDGGPIWSDDMNDAQPLYPEGKLLSNHTSLLFEPELDGGTWLMLYGGHAQPVLRAHIADFVRPVDDALFYDRDAGVYLRTAKQPWGPWSDPVTLFNPYTPGQGGYCEAMYFEDPEGKTGFACPPNAEEHNARLNRSPGIGMGGEYGAALIPHYNEAAEDTFRLRFLLSTWNPYRVILLESTFSTCGPRH